MIDYRTYSRLYGNNKNLDKGSDVLTDIEEYEKMGWIVVGSLCFFCSKILVDGGSVPFDIQNPHLADNADDLIDSGVVRMLPDGNQCELTEGAISFINDFVDNGIGRRAVERATELWTAKREGSLNDNKDAGDVFDASEGDILCGGDILRERILRSQKRLVSQFFAPQKPLELTWNEYNIISGLLNSKSDSIALEAGYDLAGNKHLSGLIYKRLLRQSREYDTNGKQVLHLYLGDFNVVRNVVRKYELSEWKRKWSHYHDELDKVAKYIQKAVAKVEDAILWDVVDIASTDKLAINGNDGGVAKYLQWLRDEADDPLTGIAVIECGDEKDKVYIWKRADLWLKDYEDKTIN